MAWKRADIGNLPLYNQDHDDRQPAPVRHLKAEIRAADAILFFTPEYNRSISGVLKNAIDHASRPRNDSAWASKPAGVIGVSVSPIGTACAQQHLKNILAALDMPLFGHPELYLHEQKLFDDGEAAGLRADSQELLQGWTTKFVGWVERCKAGYLPTQALAADLS